MISIIVPVYKAEKYLRRCIDSVLAQTYKDWELILVDDGTPDASGKICDEYARKLRAESLELREDQIRVFHKENGGVSSARNLGLDNAKGEWITFIDADDFFKGDCLERCIQEVTINNLQMLQFGRYDYVSESQQKVCSKNSTDVTTGRELVAKRNNNVTVWGTVFNADLIKKANLRFDTKLKQGEDSLFVLKALFECERVKYISTPLIYYTVNPEGASHNKKSEDMINMAESFIDLAYEHPEVKPWADQMITIALVVIISNGDVPYRTISRLYKKANIQESSTGLEGQHIKIAKVSHLLAYSYLKLKFILSNFINEKSNIRN